MKIRKSAVIFTGLMLAFAVLIPASAQAKKGGTHLPVRGKGTGNSCTTLATGVFHYTGTGTGAHIGKYSWDSEGQGGFTEPGISERYEGSGSFTATVASGAQFFGTFTFVSEDAALAVHHDTVDLEITGGTGRLDGITGGITETATLSTYFYDGVTACASTESRSTGWVSLNK